MRGKCVMLAVLMLGIGCGGAPSGPPLYEVSGTVRFEGELVPEGEIAFIPEPADIESGSVQSAKIEGGEFHARVTSGSKRIEIYAQREVPGKIEVLEDGRMVPVVESYIPPKYNEASELTANVTSEDNPPLSFDLK
ncbi:hypothetical protein Pan216_09410 [Planctomycetes bacterium Pan216]|uniref:Uncharacterized protein n=1 Tax=Kolteria novifilia TaxID=2527975 RepID=A0A518AZG7_9BACT|nr:hypothetical protein Pan216_09410 [Planctomycetes bacterium Pan216]